jgi:hypothetical protein
LFGKDTTFWGREETLVSALFVMADCGILREKRSPFRMEQRHHTVCGGLLADAGHRKEIFELISARHRRLPLEVGLGSRLMFLVSCSFLPLGDGELSYGVIPDSLAKHIQSITSFVLLSLFVIQVITGRS